MMSRNWFFNFMIEDWKRRLWAIALVSLLFFFSFPVAVVFVAGTRYTMDPNWLRDFTAFASLLVSKSNGWMAFITAVLSVVCAASGFSWLNSRKKVDFYHSLPIRREKIFIVNYINGILIMAVPYMVFLAIACGIAASQGISPAIFIEAAEGWGYFMVYYLMLYSTVAIAVIMTGNLIVGLLGTCFFFFYGPLVLLLAEGYFGTWFYTFCDDGMFFDKVRYVSPFIDFCVGESISAGFFASRLAVGIVLTAIAFLLYRKRPSEAAGKAMAFTLSKPVIRILMVIASSLSGAVFFWNLRMSLGWAVFGLLTAGLICHCVIEIIYHFDFKKLFSHYKQLLICFAASLAVLFSFRFDLFGYDRYLPDEEKVESAAVLVSGLDGWVDYGQLSPYKGSGYYGDVRISLPQYEEGNGRPYIWIGESRDDHLLREMKLSDRALVLSLAQKGIRQTKEIKDQEMSAGQQPWDILNSYRRNEEAYTELTLQYTLSSGKQVRRKYTVDMDEAKEDIQNIFDSGEYKDSAYPLLKMKPEEARRAELEYMGETVRFDQAQAEKILAAYQEDLKALKMEDIQGMIPAGSIRFLTEAGCVQMDWEEEQERQYKNYYSNSYRDAEYYPVYECFSSTMALIGPEHEQLVSQWKDQIERIQLTDERSFYDSGLDVYTSGLFTLVTDKDEVRELEDLLMPQKYYNFNSYNLHGKEFLGGEVFYLAEDYAEDPQSYADVTYDTDSVLADVTKVPKKYLDRMRYDEMTEKIEAAEK